jgi:hypothetical protein
MRRVDARDRDAERLVVEDEAWVREELELALARFSERSG